MDFELSEEQKSLAALMIDFFEQETTPQTFNECISRDPKDRIPRDLLKKAADVGLLTLAVPQRYGGGGMGVGHLLTQVVLAERGAQYGGHLSQLLWLHWKWCTDMAALGSRELQDEFFPKIMADPGFTLGDVATEPEHGSDPRYGTGMDTFAYRDGDEYVINGEKCFTDSCLVDLRLVFVRTKKNTPIRESMSAIYVPKDAPGFSCTRIDETICEFIRPIGENLFDNCRVPARYLLGEENKGYDILEGRCAGWLGFCGFEVGAAQAIWDMTKEYAKTRIQGGKPIFEHLTIGERMVAVYTAIEQARLLVYKTAWEYDKTGEVLLSSLGANLCIAVVHDLSKMVAELAAEVYGARAAMKDLPIEGYIRGAFGTAHIFQTSTMNRIMAMNKI